MFRAIVLILVLLLTPSCAALVSYRKAVDSFIESTSCCTSMAEFKYEQLPSGESVTFTLDGNSDSFVFLSGKSYFKAFRLPKKELPYRIHVKSFALGDGIDKAHIFYPQLALLDDSFTVRKMSDPEDFMLKKTAFKETLGIRLKLEGSMVVDMPDARYLVIYTTEKLMGTSTEYLAKKSNVIYTGFPPADLTFMALQILTKGGALVRVEPVDIPNSPFGNFQIKVAD